MADDFLLLLLIGVVVFLVLSQSEAAPANPSGVTARVGPYGAAIDYGSEAQRGRCCG